MDELERRKEEIRRRAEQEIAKLEERAEAALERKINPTVSKFTAAMERAARRMLRANPACVDDFSFRRALVEREIESLLETMLRIGEEDKNSAESGERPEEGQRDYGGHTAYG